LAQARLLEIIEIMESKRDHPDDIFNVTLKAFVPNALGQELSSDFSSHSALQNATTHWHGLHLLPDGVYLFSW
jgi:hypothetical protein